jgi:hypothetical protein
MYPCTHHRTPLTGLWLGRIRSSAGFHEIGDLVLVVCCSRGCLANIDICAQHCTNMLSVISFLTVTAAHHASCAPAQSLWCCPDLWDVESLWQVPRAVSVHRRVGAPRRACTSSNTVCYWRPRLQRNPLCHEAFIDDRHDLLGLSGLHWMCQALQYDRERAREQRSQHNR